MSDNPTMAPASWSLASGTHGSVCSTPPGTRRAAGGRLPSRPTAPSLPAGARGSSTSRPTRCCTRPAPPGCSTSFRAWGADAPVEGLLVDYLHFYGDVDTIVTNRHWYRREVRVLRLGRDVRSFGDAQGFRVGDSARRVRARPTGAQMFHYGWARRGSALAAKRAAFRDLFTEHEGRPGPEPPHLDWTPGLHPFQGTHPRAALEWVAERRGRGPGIGPRRVRVRDVRYYLSDWIERATGVRVFEYRNYVPG